MSETNNTLEILVNLIYLVRHSTDQPQKLIEYLDEAESQVWQLAKSVQRPPATVQGERSPN